MNNHRKIVIVTGSSGFIGSALAKRLSSHYQIVGLDQGIPGNPLPGVDYFALNMASSESVEDVVERITQRHGTEIASVIHLVAYYNFNGEPSPKYQEITVDGTGNLLKSLKKNAHVDQFIFSSSMLVHAPSDNLIRETDPLRPGWAYPESKVAAEKVIHDNRGPISILNLRIAGVYEDHCHSIPISQHISRIYECQFSSALFPGNDQHGQSFLHLEDLIDAIEIAVERREKLPQETTVLLGEKDVLTYREMQELIGKHTHDVRWPTIRVPQFFAKAGAHVLGKIPGIREPFIKPWMIQYSDDNYRLDLGHAKRLLGWEPRRSLRNALPIMIHDLKADPEKWYKYNKIEIPKVRTIRSITSGEQRLYWAAAFINIFLGIWLISNPFTLGQMGRYEYWNDIVCGFLVIVFSIISLVPSLRNFRWINAVLGSWLMFAPLWFWSKSPAMYSNDTLIGGLILLFAGFTPSTRDDKDEVPAGWSYNPSAWLQRLPIMTLAFIGFLLARYLAAFQLGHIPEVWEPFFGDGSERILKSDVSKAFPVSDGGLGAMSYLMDVIAAAIGDRNRWRTMPWMVILFGLFIVPTGVTSITLVMLQPIAVNAWCTICLITAFIMLVMVPPAVDEVVATVQFLRRSVRSGQPFWRTFWGGGEDNVHEYVAPEVQAKGTKINIIGSALLGGWLLFVPELMNLEGTVANNIYIIGALVITFSVIAYADVARLVRVFILPLAAWLSVLPWLIGELDLLAKSIVMSGGLALIFLSIPRGKVKQHFGSFDPWVHFKLSELAQWFNQRRHLQR